MARFVRNLHTKTTTDIFAQISILWHYAEMLRVAGYTYNSDDGDPAWASALNVLIDEPGAGNGFAVDPVEPNIIYDPLGRFTQAMADNQNAIGLNASNDLNAGAWRISDYLGPNRVRIDYNGRPAYGWTLETDIPGRVWNVDGLQPGNGSWILFDAPFPNRMQVRLTVTSYQSCWISIIPSGQDVSNSHPTLVDIAFAAGTCTLTDTDAANFTPNMVGRNITIAGSGAGNNGTFIIASYISATQITYANAGGANENPFTGTWTVDGDAAETNQKQIGHHALGQSRMHMVSDGADVLLYDWAASEYTNVHVMGELDGAEPEDADSNCLWGSDDADVYGGRPWRYSSFHIDENGAHLTGYPTFLKAGWDTQAQYQFTSKGGRRLVNGFAFLRSPWAAMEDTADGGYVRGRIPLVRFGWQHFARCQPIDGSGLWQHFFLGLVVPRNGPNDPLPLRG